MEISESQDCCISVSGIGIPGIFDPAILPYSFYPHSLKFRLFYPVKFSFRDC